MSYQKNPIIRSLFFGVITIGVLISGISFAQPVGCPSGPIGTGQTINCSTASSSGSPQTSTTAITVSGSSDNNNDITITRYTTIQLSGSPIGLASGNTVSNSGTLNSNSFTSAYGMSAGANGRSQAGGNNFTNTSTGSIVTGGSGAAGIYISATNSSSAANIITNAGSITTSGPNADGIRLNSGSKTGVNSVVNSGTISTSGASSNGIDILGTAQVTVENTGSITTTGSNSFGIYSSGNITTLNNSQGGSSPLTYSGVLPLNYNVIVTNPATYGKLDASGGNVSGVMNFGIKSGSTLAFNTTYSTVLSGIKVNNLGSSYGSFTAGGNTYQWALAHRINGSSDQTDLVVLPAPVAPTLPAIETALQAESYLIAPIYYDTQTALTSLGNTLQSIFAMQTSGVVNSMTYDCPLFGANNVCVSAGGRFTNISGYPDNTTSALIIGAYRYSPSLRFGAYLDQNLMQSTPGGIAQLNNGAPMVGLFGVWSQNADGSGIEAKVSAAYTTKGATLTRPVVGVSEAGSGSTNLTTQGVQGILKYGFNVGNKSLVSPYAGMRYVLGGMGGYSESQSSTVSSPLTYSSISNYTTTALAGLIARHRLDEKIILVGSAGLEKDVNANVGNLITSGIGDFNIAMNSNYRTLRPTATIAAYYDLSTKEQIGLVGIYRQEAYQALTSSTVLATYTVGL